MTIIKVFMMKFGGLFVAGYQTRFMKSHVSVNKFILLIGEKRLLSIVEK